MKSKREQVKRQEWAAVDILRACVRLLTILGLGLFVAALAIDQLRHSSGALQHGASIYDTPGVADYSIRWQHLARDRATGRWTLDFGSFTFSGWIALSGHPLTFQSANRRFDRPVVKNGADGLWGECRTIAFRTRCAPDSNYAVDIVLDRCKSTTEVRTILNTRSGGQMAFKTNVTAESVTITLWKLTPSSGWVQVGSDYRSL